MTEKQILALAKSYTDISVEGAGAIKGKNCQIQSIEAIEGGNRITFAWYNGSDVLVSDTLDVMDGQDGAKGDKGDKGDKGNTGDTGNGIASITKTSTVGNVDTYTITMTDGTTATFTVTNGGVNVVANPEGVASESLTKVQIGDEIYSVSQGGQGTSDYTELENKPQINSVTLAGNKTSSDLGLADKSVVDGILNGTSIDSFGDVETALALKADVSDIPDSLDDLADDEYHRTVTDTEKSTWSGKADVSAIPTTTSDLTNDSGFITNAVNNLVNYYLKSETYSQSEIDAIIAAAKNGRFIYVTTLPTTDIDTKAIYLVPSSDPEAGNVKDEYINTDGTTSGWELIGSTAIDLSNYIQKSATAGLVKNDGTIDTVAKASQASVDAILNGTSIDSFGDVETALSAKQDTISDLSTIRSGASAGATAVQPSATTGLLKNDGTVDTVAKASQASVDAITDGTNIDSFSDVETALSGKQDTISDLATIRSGASAGATAYQKPQTGIPSTDLASGVIPDITGKADKVSNVTSGNFAGLDANGNLTDSGKKATDFAPAPLVLSQTVTLDTTAATPVTFTNAAITDGKHFSLETSIWNMVPDDITTSEGVCVVTLPKWSSAETIGVLLYVR